MHRNIATDGGHLQNHWKTSRSVIPANMLNLMKHRVVVGTFRCCQSAVLALPVAVDRNNRAVFLFARQGALDSPTLSLYSKN